MNDMPPRKTQISPLVRISTGIDHALLLVEKLTVGLAVVALFAIMVLIFFDGVLRYVANAPLKFATDIVVLYLISAGFLLVLSYTLRKGGHISVDVFVGLMPTRLRRVLYGGVLLLAVPVVGIMSWEMVKHSWESWVNGEVLIGLYALPLWLSKAIVAVGLVVLNIRLLHIGLFDFLAGVTGRDELAIAIEAMAEHPQEEGV
jgi:TRAP-type C4-dicarboxylate transport system permease small subunit